MSLSVCVSRVHLNENKMSDIKDWTNSKAKSHNHLKPPLIDSFTIKMLWLTIQGLKISTF